MERGSRWLIWTAAVPLLLLLLALYVASIGPAEWLASTDRLSIERYHAVYRPLWRSAECLKLDWPLERYAEVWIDQSGLDPGWCRMSSRRNGVIGGFETTISCTFEEPGSP